MEIKPIVYAPTTRPDRDQYGMIQAIAASARGDCTRRKVGAAIIDTDYRLVITGYNGSPPGHGSCLAGACPRGKHYQKQEIYSDFDDKGGYIAQRWSCGCGHKTWPCPNAAEPGSSYDTGPNSCIALHAEQNAIIYADPLRLRGSTMYITDAPCDGCVRLINGVRIARVVTMEMVPDQTGALKKILESVRYTEW